MISVAASLINLTIILSFILSIKSQEIEKNASVLPSECLVLSNHLSKIQKYLVYYHTTLRKAAKPQISEDDASKYLAFFT